MFPFWLCKYYSVIQKQTKPETTKRNKYYKNKNAKPANKQNNLKWNDNPGEREEESSRQARYIWIRISDEDNEQQHDACVDGLATLSLEFPEVPDTFF